MRFFLAVSLLALCGFPQVLRAQEKTDTVVSPPPGDSKHHDIQPAELIKRVAPVYPKKARQQGVEGTVRLHAIIAKDGSVRNLEVISGPALLADAARKAVRQWRYRPVHLDGRAVEVDTTIDVNFALNHSS